MPWPLASLTRLRPMPDPLTPEIMAFLAALPPRDRLVRMYAIGNAYPALHHSPEWRAMTLALRAEIKPTADELAEILSEADGIGETLPR